MKELLGAMYLGSTTISSQRRNKDGTPITAERFYDLETGTAFEVDFTNNLYRRGNGRTWAQFSEWKPLPAATLS